MLRKALKKSQSLIACALTLTLAMPGAAFAGAIYSDAKAQSLAKKKVGQGAVVTQVESDQGKDGMEYEVELVKGSKKYSLTYRAKDSKLIEYKWELKSKSNQKRTGKDLTKVAIKKKALAQVSGKITSLKKKVDDGITEYVVKLTKGSKRFELTYNAKSGSLMEYEWKITGTSTSSKYIGVAKAKHIALKKVPGATIVKAELETDDGTPVYEIEMTKGSHEYELVIHAKTGKILEYDKDWRD